MRASRLGQVGLAGAIAAVALVVGSPAWANTTININPGNVQTTAAGFDSHECDANFGGGPFPGQDVWVFVLPGNHNTSGDFVSLTATFNTGTIMITAVANPGMFANGGPATSKAFIVTPAGSILTAASAVITGTADFFNLTHTCPASGSPSPSASMTPSTSASASPSVTVTATATGTTATPAMPSGPARTGGGGGLPAGGMAWGLSALTVAFGSGIGLMLARRRRDSA